MPITLSNSLSTNSYVIINVFYSFLNLYDHIELKYSIDMSKSLVISETLENMKRAVSAEE